MNGLAGVDSRGRDWIAVGLLAMLAVMVAFLVFSVGWWMGSRSVDPFSQMSFPCQEDEVLAYSPSFGSERVGCVHVEGDALVP